MKFSEVLHGYIPPSDAQRAEIWGTADFCLDSSVLLNLYRYSESSRTDFLSLLRTIKNRLFVPHRVALEFARNRAKVIRAHPKPHRHISDHLDKLAGEMVREFPKHPDLNALKELLSAAKKTVDEKVADITAKQAKLISDDAILRELVEIVGDDVGEPYPSGELTKEYERRKKDNIPPYCKTDDKEKGEEERKGDVAVWLELMERYKGTGKPLVFTIDDMKPNWWQESGGSHEPIPGLVREMHDQTKSDILFYTSGRFIEKAKEYLNLAVSNDLAEETKEIHRRVAEDMNRNRWRDGYRQLLESPAGFSLPGNSEPWLSLSINEAIITQYDLMAKMQTVRARIAEYPNLIVRATDAAATKEAIDDLHKLEAALADFGRSHDNLNDQLYELLTLRAHSSGTGKPTIEDSNLW